ncbi:uncharacterized protein LOC144444837 [Glandiceps talaboti]
MAEAPDPSTISQIRPLNILFMELEKALSEKEVTTMKNLLHGTQLTTQEMERVDSATELFQCLEAKGHIKPDNLDLILNLLEAIKRSPLKKRVIQYLEDNEYRERRQEGQISIHANVKDVKLRGTPDQKYTREEAFSIAVVRVYQSVDLSKEGALQEVRQHVEDIRGLILQESRRASLETVLRCEHRDALEQLWSQYHSGVVQQVYQKAIVTDQLLESLQAEHVIIEVTISEDEYWQCKEDLILKKEHAAWEKIDECNGRIEEIEKLIEKTQDPIERQRLDEESQRLYGEQMRLISERGRLLKEEYRAHIIQLEEMSRDTTKKSPEELETMNVEVETMRADAEEQTEKIDEDIEVINTQLGMKERRMEELEVKLRYKTEEEIDRQIQQLQDELEKKTMTPGDRIKLNDEIGNLNKSKEMLKEYQALKDEAESDRLKQSSMAQEKEMFHEKADRLKDIEDRIHHSLGRMTLKEEEDWAR